MCTWLCTWLDTSWATSEGCLGCGGTERPMWASVIQVLVSALHLGRRQRCLLAMKGRKVVTGAELHGSAVRF